MISVIKIFLAKLSSYKAVTLEIAHPITCVIFIPLPPLERRRRHSVFGISVRTSVRAWSYTKSLLTRCLINRSWEFQQLYNSGAVWAKYELARFWGQCSWSQRDHIWWNKHLERHGSVLISPQLGIALNKMEKNAGDLGLQCRDSVKV